MNLETLRGLWAEFADTPITEDDKLDNIFHHFPRGTDRMEVWHWFDEQSNGVLPPR